MNVVALRIEVRPEPISVQSQADRLKVMASFNSPVSTNALETRQPKPADTCDMIKVHFDGIRPGLLKSAGSESKWCVP